MLKVKPLSLQGRPVWRRACRHIRGCWCTAGPDRSDHGVFRAKCHLCNVFIFCLPSKPTAILGKWPYLWCARCRKSIRSSLSSCLGCGLRVRECRCGTAGVGVLAGRRERQTSLHRFWQAGV
eukprot:1922297-Alexandrium_andersonii.AAC.1